MVWAVRRINMPLRLSKSVKDQSRFGYGGRIRPSRTASRSPPREDACRSGERVAETAVTSAGVQMIGQNTRAAIASDDRGDLPSTHDGFAQRAGELPPPHWRTNMAPIWAHRSARTQWGALPSGPPRVEEKAGGDGAPRRAADPSMSRHRPQCAPDPGSPGSRTTSIAASARWAAARSSRRSVPAEARSVRRRHEQLPRSKGRRPSTERTRPVCLSALAPHDGPWARADEMLCA